MSKRIISRVFIRQVRKTSLRLLVLALIVASLTASAWAWLSPPGQAEPATPSARAEAVAPPAQSISSQERVEAEIITIRPTGFEPAEITRPAGRFFLTVENRSGLDAVNLRLSSENGNHLRDARMSRDEPDWNDLVDLDPGRYLLTEADHANWVCRITITAP
jgi:hypothetical protein